MMADARDAPTRPASGRQRSAAARIKLSKELVLRLSSALTERGEWARPAPLTARHQDHENSNINGGANDANSNHKQLANCSMKATTTTPARELYHGRPLCGHNELPKCSVMRPDPGFLGGRRQASNNKAECTSEIEHNNNNSTTTTTNNNNGTAPGEACAGTSQKRLGSLAGRQLSPAIAPPLHCQTNSIRLTSHANEPPPASVSTTTTAGLTPSSIRGASLSQLANPTSCSTLNTGLQRVLAPGGPIWACNQRQEGVAQQVGRPLRATTSLKLAQQQQPSHRNAPNASRSRHHYGPAKRSLRPKQVGAGRRPAHSAGPSHGNETPVDPSRRRDDAQDASASKSTVILISSNETEIEAEWEENGSGASESKRARQQTECSRRLARRGWQAAGELAQTLINSEPSVAGRQCCWPHQEPRTRGRPRAEPWAPPTLGQAGRRPAPEPDSTLTATLELGPQLQAPAPSGPTRRAADDEKVKRKQRNKADCRSSPSVACNYRCGRPDQKLEPANESKCYRGQQFEAPRLPDRPLARGMSTGHKRTASCWTDCVQNECKNACITSTTPGQERPKNEAKLKLRPRLRAPSNRGARHNKSAATIAAFWLNCATNKRLLMSKLLALSGLLLLASSLALAPRLATGSGLIASAPAGSSSTPSLQATPGLKPATSSHLKDISGYTSALNLVQGGHQQPAASDATTSDESDELSRAIWATMSTQSTLVASSGALDDQWLAMNSSLVHDSGPTTPARPSLSDFTASSDHGQPATRFERFLDEALNFARIFVMGAIIVGDICGNSLVILSVCRHSKLRVTTNWFVVSLACADILVALFAMTFNASVIISGRWLFKRWVCDFWNSCDVLASTASILHLCCISIDRYIAIMRPLDYPMKITTRRVMWALCAVWVSSALLSYIPIFTGIYTTSEHIEWLRENPDQCEFVVNRVYAIVSSSISFWIPCCIMVFTYYRIYREATRQEKFIYKAQSLAPAANHQHQHQQHQHQNHSNQHKRAKQGRSKSVAAPSGSGLGGQSQRLHQQLAQQTRQKLRALPANRDLLPAPTSKAELVATTNLSCKRAGERDPLTGSAVDLNNNNSNSNSNNDNNTDATSKPLGGPEAAQAQQQLADDDHDDRDSNSGQSTPTKRSISKMKREHKAAKTLGIIMGVFILCWLPFFSWYTPQHICGHACEGMVPRQVVTLLFWIGYFNSTLNPIIYAYFNHEFRDAFKKTLQWIFCCCQDLKCLRVSRPNEGQHYNCTYRSTQEIGLVSN